EGMSLRLHPHVHLAAQQRLLDLLHEEGLAAEVGQRDLGEAVPGGPDRHDLDLGPARPQRARHRFALHEREAAASRAEANLHSRESGRPGPRSPNSSEIISVQRRAWPAREESLSLTMGACRTLFTIAWLRASITRRVSSPAPGSRPRARSSSARRMASSF